MSWLAPIVGVRVMPSIIYMHVGKHLYLRNALSPLSPAQHSPCDAARILALQKEGFALAALEAEDLAISSDKQFALDLESASCSVPFMFIYLRSCLHAV